MEPHQNTSLREFTPTAPFSPAWEDKKSGTHPEDGKALEFSIFEGKKFLRNDRFFKEKVIVGKSEEADLILSGRNVSDIHAFFYLNGDQISVSDGDLGSGVMVNGRFVSSRILSPSDSVIIGPFTLKVKLDKFVSQIPESEPLPTDKLTEPTDKPTDSLTDRLTEPTDKLTEPTDKLTKSTDKLTEPTDKLTEPTDEPTEPTG